MNFIRRPKGELIQWLMLMALLVISPLFLPPEPGEKGYDAPFQTEKLQQLTKATPEVVLIGNSMTDTRVDLEVLDKFIHPYNSAFLVEHGSRSTMWYLLFKNFALNLNPPPKLVVVFFRDYDFTNPALKLTGPKLRELYSFMQPGDEQLVDLASSTQPTTRPQSIFAQKYLSEHLSNDMRRRISEWSMDFATLGQSDGAEKKLQKHLDQVFAFTELRGDVFDAGALDNDLTTNTPAPFTADPTQNLLPHFVELAKKHHIHLCFYRVKRRPDKRSVDNQNSRLTTYINDFREWAESQGCTFIDERPDPRLTLSMYGNGDHLAAPAKPAYTAIFHERIRPLLSIR